MTVPLTGDTFVEAARALGAADHHLAASIESWGVPAFWHRPEGFASLALFIVEQQVSLASAKAVFDRLVAGLGAVTAASVTAADPDLLRSAGLTRQKLRYLQGLAVEVEDGDLDLGALAGRSDDDARAALLAVTGIGPWTADVYLLSALRRPDVWPVGDRALQVGLGEVMEIPTPSPAEMVALGKRWRPYRSVAARLIWNDYLARRGRAETEVAGLG